MDKILSDKMGHDMEALVWETAEELDKKTGRTYAPYSQTAEVRNRNFRI